jgi:phage tail-like protein
MNETDLISFASEAVFAYPAEVIRLNLRPGPGALQPGRRMRVLIPHALTVEGFSFQKGGAGSTILTSEEDQNTVLSWQWEEPIPASEELAISIRVTPDAENGFHTCQASLLDEEGELVFGTGLRLKVKRLADSFRYMPEIYQRDDFTNRFLMLLESFWKPISRQIDQGEYYYDPHLTPNRFLPWLAGWFGLELENGLPEERRRDLLSMIMPIYGQKGTRQTLKTVLGLYSGGEVQIVEHLDENLVLGKDAHLGYQVALGKNNRPHSFDVTLKVPDAFVQGDPDSRVRHEQYRRRIANLINMYKPAQTLFRLEIEFLQS